MDIDKSQITIKEFQEIGRTQSDMGNNKSERLHQSTGLESQKNAPTTQKQVREKG
jgi:hypothetical protein